MLHAFNFFCERKIAVSYSIGRVMQVISSKGIAFLKAVFFNQLKEFRNCLVKYLKSGQNALPCYSFGYWQNWNLNFYFILFFHVEAIPSHCTVLFRSM